MWGGERDIGIQVTLTVFNLQWPSIIQKLMMYTNTILLALFKFTVQKIIFYMLQTIRMHGFVVNFDLLPHVRI